jgi:hypothetical protein
MDCPESFVFGHHQTPHGADLTATTDLIVTRPTPPVSWPKWSVSQTTSSGGYT